MVDKIKRMVGWCPNASITERKTRVEYNPASINAGLPVKKWRFDLLILGHVCALLFASLFILPMSVHQTFYLYNSSYLALNYGNFLADITLAVASTLFSVATVMLIYNTFTLKKLYSKLCYFNVILLSGLFIAIILELSLVDDFRLEESLYWAFVFALLPLIPSLMNIRFNKRYGEQKIVTEGLGLVELIKRAMGWCPNVTKLRYRSMQPVDFEYTSLEPSGESNVESIQSNNIAFPTNSSLFTLCFVICFYLVIPLAQNMDYAISIPILVGMYSLFYFIVVKTFQANISIDDNGVHFKSFGLRDFTLNYRDIKSVTPNKYAKPSIVFMAAMLIILAAMLAYSIISGEWQLFILIVLLLPWYLLVKHKQDRKYHDLDTQLYVEHKNKKWYELTPYYSIVTDELTASRMQTAIEHYREEQ